LQASIPHSCTPKFATHEGIAGQFKDVLNWGAAGDELALVVNIGPIKRLPEPIVSCERADQCRTEQRDKPIVTILQEGRVAMVEEDKERLAEEVRPLSANIG
jgi:hypothetical protein